MYHNNNNNQAGRNNHHNQGDQEDRAHFGNRNAQGRHNRHGHHNQHSQSNAHHHTMPNVIVPPGEDPRAHFEKLVTSNPNCGRYWKSYIEHEMKSRNYEKVEKLFGRCLVKVLHIDLWRCYLNYVKETKHDLPSFGEKMAQAYDFALEKIGMDISSYPIWHDYVEYLKSVNAVGSYAENQKITATRRVYQKGVVNPMINIEQFWRDYVIYEQEINRIIAEKMVTDRSRDYMNARRVAKEYEAVTRGINKNALSVVPQGTAEEAKQVELWRKYIAWEKSNPLRSEDMAIVIKRVIFAYEQCLLCLAYYPDIWYEFASYLDENSKLMAEKGDANQFKTLQDQAADVFERASSSFLKNNLLINFAFADFEEARNKKDAAGKIYEKLLECQEKEFDPTLAYIQYMKFKRRTDSVQSARSIFKRGRDDSRSGHEIFTAAALMEYYCSKDTVVACRIFELGLKNFGDHPDFLLSYIEFLSHLNEENNTRVLFERILTSTQLPAEKSLDIWNKFLEFESHIGDLSSVIKVEKRRAQAIEKVCKSMSETAWLVDRYKFLNLLPCNVSELRSIGYTVKGQQRNPFTPVATSDTLIQPNTTSSSSTSISTYPKPDFSQMLPFKPKIDPMPGSHTIPGGIFPPPPAAGALLAQLPHPSSFRGPFVSVDDLMNLFRVAQLIPPKPEGLTGEKGKKLFENASSVANTNASANANSKRINASNEDEDEADGDGSNPVPPQFDIYRTRQMQKRPKI